MSLPRSSRRSGHLPVQPWDIFDWTTKEYRRNAVDEQVEVGSGLFEAPNW
jgi:hypothetical protein